MWLCEDFLLFGSFSGSETPETPNATRQFTNRFEDNPLTDSVQRSVCSGSKSARLLVCLFVCQYVFMSVYQKPTLSCA